MQISVRLAEPFWHSVGQRQLEIELQEGARVSDLLALLRRRYPALEREFTEAPPHVFLGDQEGTAETLLEDGCAVHLVWPVAGGSHDF